MQPLRASLQNWFGLRMQSSKFKLLKNAATKMCPKFVSHSGEMHKEENQIVENHKKK